MKPRYLFLFQIGPVQEFIATARRTRDLFAGSRLLSEAAQAAAQALGERYGFSRLIFPAPKDRGELEDLGRAGIPNLLLLEVEDPEEAAQRAKEAILDYLEGRAARLAPHLDGEAYQRALAQILDLPEVYWAYVPLDGDYAQARGLVGAAMAFRKNTRDFRAVPWGDRGPKSSLDGSRESVTTRLSRDQRLRLGLGEGEELSGVDLLKRLWPRDQVFLSTLHLAALPFVLGLKRRGKEEEVEARLRPLGLEEENPHPALRDTLLARYTPALFFPGQLLIWLKERLGEGAEARYRELEPHLRPLWKEAPYPYYALLHADGDRMGAFLDRLSAKGPEAHRAFSRALALGFAGEVRGIVEAHRGALVYSGGDDVLALLPLHTALRAARALYEHFAEVMARTREELGLEGEIPTLSMGLAVVHFTEPLQDALELARKAEGISKRGLKEEGVVQEGRNALTLLVSPRSGGELAVFGRWDEAFPLGRRLARYVDLLLQDLLPDGAAYELKALARELGHLPEALRGEARRILGRKRMDQAHLEEILALVERLGVGRLADELLVARHLLPAYRLAEAKGFSEKREVLHAH